MTIIAIGTVAVSHPSLVHISVKVATTPATKETITLYQSVLLPIK